MDKINVDIFVNGKAVSLLVKDNARLLDVLRENLYLTRTKAGYGGEGALSSVKTG